MTDLLATTAELVDIASVSHHEHVIADHLERRLREAAWLDVERVDDNVVARTRLGRPSRVILAGHTDTVPPNGNERPRLEGDTLWGLGAADMKSGLAVMLKLATSMPEPSVDVTYAFYVCEEVARADNGLSRLFAVRPDLLAGDAAILGEPTGGAVEAGCQGVLKLSVTMKGERAHSARPWMGVNAVHRLGPLLDAVAGYAGREPVVEGCRYREALQAVRVGGGVADNVVPDSATVVLNCRFAPDRDASAALRAVSELLDPVLDRKGGDAVEVIEAAPAAPPGLGHPLLRRLVDSTAQPPRAKLGWTDVALFTERGIPATNFGPGDSTLAHAAGERVRRDEVEGAFTLLSALIGG